MSRFAALAVVAVVAGCAGPPAPAPTTPSTPRAATAPPPTPTATIAGPDRPWVAYQRWGPGLTTHIGLMRDDGTEEHVLEVTGPPIDDQSHPAWTPDGTRIGFDVYFDDPMVTIGQRVEPWWVGVDGGQAERLASCELPCLQHAYPAFSPEGRSVALLRYDVDGDVWGPSALEIVDLASGGRQTIAETDDGLSAWYHPRWSPDGGAIVVAVETYTDASQGTITGLSLGVVEVGATPPAPISIITPPDVLARDPDWGGAEGRISFSRVSALPPDMSDAVIFTMQPDGSDVRAVIEGPAGVGSQPTWDPNEARLVFTFDDDEPDPATIGFIGTDGADVSILPVDGAGRTHPRIQPMTPSSGG